ncbi:MAG: hypothetical protein WCG73_01210 [Candidatus Moraniibacteriota bacterium]
MEKDTQTQNTIEEYKRRLQEITQIQFGVLSDDEILRFLAERSRLSMAVSEYERIQKEELDRLEREKKEAARKVAEKKRVILLKKIEELNKSITPEKKDDDLLTLVSERRILESELDSINREFPQEEKIAEGKSSLPLIIEETVPVEEKISEVVAPVVSSKKEKREVGVLSAVSEKTEEITTSKKNPEIVSETLLSEPIILKEEDFGSEKIQKDGIEENSEFNHYLDQLKSNIGSLGEFLQQLPMTAKKNKAFMLKVASIDPAYAMHYADKDTLKIDEDFNMRIAAFENPRNSGNALSEMLPNARTSKVLLVAVKQDYRNLKFIQPDMVDYDEIMDIAKKGALEKVKSLKSAADTAVLLPKILQQDKQFMLEVKELIGS